MLPVEKGQGQLWLREQLLGTVSYDISAPSKLADKTYIQRVTFVLPVAERRQVLEAAYLTLATADGQRYKLPRPFQPKGKEHLECFVESYLV